MACTADKPDLVKALLCAGADLNTLASQDGGARPIWSANPGAVKALLAQFPAHLNVKELRAGGTPAHWATEKPLLEVRSLLQTNTILTLRDYWTLAALWKHATLVEMLLYM